MKINRILSLFALILCAMMLLCSCAEKNTNDEAHTHISSKEWSSNSQGHWNICTSEGCDKKFNFSAHTDIAQREVIITPATETETGIKRTIDYCTVCNYEITSVQSSIPILQKHEAAGEWKNDASGHWYACSSSGCGEKHSLATHTEYTSEITVKLPTCFEYGSKTVRVTCEVCGYKISEQTIAIVPTMSHIADGVWQSDGNAHWQECAADGCSAIVNESSHTPKTTEAHTVAPTCFEVGYKDVTKVCSVCEKVLSASEETIPATGAHAKGSQLQSNADSHWYGCTTEGCNYKFEFENHQNTTSENITKAPTCFEVGSKTVTVTCEICNYKISEQTVAIMPTGEHIKADGWLNDEASHWRTCQTKSCPYKFDNTGHTYTGFAQIDGTSAHKGACICGSEAVENCYGTEKGSDDINHWNVCAKCRGKYSVEAHNHDGGTNSDANSLWYICSCGKSVDKQTFEDTVHFVNNTPSDINLYNNGTTTYKILFDSTNSTIKLAQQHLGMLLKTAVGSSPDWHPSHGADQGAILWNENDKNIVIGNHALFEKAGLVMPSELIGETGYYIVTKGNSVFIMANDDRAYQRAVVAFLREVIGFEAYAAGCVSFDIPENKTVNLPNLEIIEKPDFDYYLTSNAHSGWVDGYGDEYYMMGFDKQATDLFINVSSYDTTYTYSKHWLTQAVSITDNGQNNEHNYNPWHNTLDYLPNKDYRTSHSKWYSDNKFGYDDSCRFDLCLTAHGDATEYEAMVAEMAKNMLVWIDANPDKPLIALTMEDHSTGICTCDACTTMKEQYNGSDAAALIKFVNAVNRVIQSELQRRADESGDSKREIKIVTFAYHQTYKAPARQNADGSWSAVDNTVVCDDEVAVMIAPIEMNAGRSIYDPENKEYKDAFDAWAACTDNIFVWCYNTNFINYMYPCYTVEYMAESYAYYKGIGAEYLWAQGQHNTKSPTGFSVLKDYLNSKLLFDVLDNDIAAMTDRFFDNYFLEASESMRTYYDELMAHLKCLEADEEVRSTDVLNGEVLGRVTHTKLNDPDLWTKAQLDGWMEDINNAYAAIAHYENTDPTLYNALVKRIKLESIFIRYAQIDLYASSYDSGTLLEMKQSFKADCAELNITLLGESESLDGVWTKWGV